MGWKNCSVVLNKNSSGFFLSGDIVTGSVILQFKNRKKIEHIDFKVVGKSKAQWSRPQPTIPYIKIYSESKKFLDLNIDVFSELDSETFSPGIYNFRFHFHLPKDIPSTFKSSIAKINYFIIIEDKNAYKFKRKHMTRFIVLRNTDINHIEEYLKPFYTEIQQIFWNTAKFALRIKTYKGFALKQEIPFEISIKNEKKVNISILKVSLIQKIKYTITAGYAQDEKKLYEVKHGNISNSIDEYYRFKMEIPQISRLIPSNINLTNSMVDVSYVFRITLIFPYHCSLVEDLPVTIATVPVKYEE